MVVHLVGPSVDSKAACWVGPMETPSVDQMAVLMAVPMVASWADS